MDVKKYAIEYADLIDAGEIDSTLYTLDEYIADRIGTAIDNAMDRMEDDR